MLATSMAYKRLKYFHKISSLELIEKIKTSVEKRGTNNSQKEEIQMANKHVRKSTL